MVKLNMRYFMHVQDEINFIICVNPWALWFDRPLPKSQEILTCKEWMGKEIYSEEEMRKFSLEEVKQDLKTHGACDSVSPVVAVVLEVGEGGVIIQTIPSLLGMVDSKYVDGRALWPETPEESHVKVKNIDLSSLTFRGGLASSYFSGLD